jgi:hypothetical protein
VRNNSSGYSDINRYFIASFVITFKLKYLQVQNFSWHAINYFVIFSYFFLVSCGPCDVGGVTTGYGLDGPGIESRWRRDFPHLSSPALGPAQPPVQWVPGFSRG